MDLPIERDQMINKIADWCRKNGFLLKNGTVPENSFFAAATSTANRRKLFKVLMEKVEDRRKVLKVRQYLDAHRNARGSKQDLLRKEIADLRHQISEVEAATDVCLEKMSNRVKHIKRIEDAIKDIKSKYILVSLVKNRKQAQEKKFASIDEKLEALGTKENTNDIDAQDFISNLMKEVNDRFKETSLFDEIEHLPSFEQVKSMRYESLWPSIMHYSDVIVHAIKEASESSKKEIQSVYDSGPKFCEHYSVSLAPISIARTLSQDAKLLLKSNKIDERVKEFLGEDYSVDFECTSKDEITKTIVKLDEDLMLPTYDYDEEEPLSLRLDFSEKKKSYERLLASVTALGENLKMKSQKALEHEKSILDQYSEMKNVVTENESTWRDLIRGYSQEMEEYCRLLMEAPYRCLRKTTKTTPEKPDKFAEERESFIKLIQERIDARKQDVYIQEDALSPDKWKNDDLNQPDWDVNAVRNLTRTLDKLNGLSEPIEKVRHVMKIYDEKRIREMIPASHTVNGLTLSEYEQQIKLDALPSSDRSLFINQSQR